MLVNKIILYLFSSCSVVIALLLIFIVLPFFPSTLLRSKVLGKNGNTININNKAITTEQDENKYRIILLTSNQNSYEHEKIEK